MKGLVKEQHRASADKAVPTSSRDDTELFEQFIDNDSFRLRLTDTVFTLTYEKEASP